MSGALPDTRGCLRVELDRDVTASLALTFFVESGTALTLVGCQAPSGVAIGRFDPTVGQTLLSVTVGQNRVESDVVPMVDSGVSHVAALSCDMTIG
jgi:hypothetical protein